MMTTGARRGLAPTRLVLAGGTVVLVKETHTTSAVTISVALGAGSVDEPHDRIGLAHFLSRVIDRGTAHRSADEIADGLDGRGVTLSVTSTRHSLLLSCTCLAEDFDFSLRLLGEIVTVPTFPAAEVEKRRAEILTGIRQDRDNPAAVAVEGLFALLYPGGHPYGRPAKGTIETVERLDRGAIEAFHAARCAPGGVRLVIVGDVTPARAVEAAAGVFGGWRAPTPPATAVASPPVARARRRSVVTMMSKAQADIAYGFTTIPRSDPRYDTFTLMNNALGQYSLGGRLGDSIRERQGMAYYVFSAFDGAVIESPLLIRAGVDPANVDRAIASIDDEVARLARDGLTADELDDCKRFLVGSMPRMLETNAAIARFLQTAEFFGLGIDYDLRLPERLEAVTLEQANAAAATLSPDRAALVIAGPYRTDDSRLTTDD
jgi:zinc protease